MKKILKIIVFSFWFVITHFSQAQNSDAEKFDPETIRLQKVRLIEKEVEDFISKNINNYELSNDFMKKNYSQNHENELHDELTDAQAKELLINLKKKELRKLFFYENPEKGNLYLPSQQQRINTNQCTNGGFEGVNPLNNYTFLSDNIATNLQCAVPSVTDTPANNLTSSINVNNFAALATLIDTTDPTWNAATMTFDPTLNTPAYGNIQIPTISPNGATRAIKLNNNGGGNDVTTMSRFLLIDSTTLAGNNALEYEFSLMLQSAGHGLTNEQPIFKVEIFDLNGNLIQQRCIVSQPDCNFMVAPFNGDPLSRRAILYTNWICDAIDVSALLDDAPNAAGVNARIDFTVTDCGQGGHFGTVYIDNLCGYTCPNPAFGLVSVTPPIDCLDLVDNTPNNLCGTYSLPANSVQNSLTFTINVSTNGGTTFTPVNPNNYTVTLNQIDAQNGNFCFSLSNAIFADNLTENYIFQIVQTFNQTCDAGTFTNTNTTWAVVNFQDCCLPNLTLTAINNTNNSASNDVKLRERSNWITATNIIGFGDNAFQNGVVYHAGNFVDLRPGFDAINGSQFVAYVQGCTNPNSFVYKNQQTNSNQNTEITPINLIKISRDFSIVPNPSNSSIEVIGENTEIKRIEIVSIDGKKVYSLNFEKNSNAQQVDISNFKNGIYIVTITDVYNQQYSQKLIKN